MFDYSLPYDSRRAPVFGRNMVATSHPLAAQAGLQVLLSGGNAVDAAVTVAAAMTVLEPTNNGIGSDAFAIVWDGNALHGLNASGHSPAAWTAERFAGMDAMPRRGWNSVTVPGAVSGWAALCARFGTRSLSALMEPAVRFAHDGVPVPPGIGAAWERGAKLFGENADFAAMFLPEGRAPMPGEVFRNAGAARTLEEIGATGGESFYRGALAEAIAAASAAGGGALTAEDMAAHAPDWCGTLSMPFNGTELHEIPPNGQGIAALMILGLLKHTAIADMHPDDPQAIHLMVEATKLAFADLEAHVADPGHMLFAPELLLDPGYLAERARLIDPAKAQLAPVGAPTQGGTVYLTVADASGMMVSFIQSNYAGFGSGCVVPGTGIHLQNRGFGFSLDPAHPNMVGPRKRPFHTIIPGMAMKDGKPLMSFGVMGGPIQAQGHVQMMVRTQLAGQNPQAAIDAPRWRFVKGRKLALEWSVPAATAEALTAMGHEVTVEPQQDTFGFGGAQIIAALDQGYVGGSDSRKDGAAVGY